MAIRIERIQEADGGAEFRVRVPAESADAFASLLAAAARLAESGAEGAAALSPVRPRELPGVLLRRLRLECRMTQREAAAIAGTSQARISDMESGVKPITLEAAQAFGRRFGVPPAAFLR